MEDLERWKATKKKDCLIIRGVRQCGKTFIVREFGRNHYTNVIEINFIERPDLMDAFKGSLRVDSIISNLELMMPGTRFLPNETLLFLDEIQDCPEARTSLKFWAEDGRFDVIATGSLLGISYKGIASIPVGYESQLDMYPLDFREFLWAKGLNEESLENLKQYLSGEERVPDAIHHSMIRHLREYLVIGGMPEVVTCFLETADYQAVQTKQDRLLRDYQDDIAKYAENSDRIKAKSCYLSIPRQLSKENHKFQYSVVEKKASARKFGSSLDWLAAAGMIVRSYNVSVPAFPLAAYAKEDQFRVYLSDIGLFTAMFGYQMKAALLNDTLDGPAKGGIYESLIADLFSKNGRKLYYFKKEDSTLEIEFLTEFDAKPVPVEVKARKGPTRSLNELLKDSRIPMGYKLTSQNAGRVDKKITLPMYLAMFL